MILHFGFLCEVITETKGPDWVSVKRPRVVKDRPSERKEMEEFMTLAQHALFSQSLVRHTGDV